MVACLSKGVAWFLVLTVPVLDFFFLFHGLFPWTTDANHLSAVVETVCVCHGSNQLCPVL